MRYSRYNPTPMYQAESFKDLAVVPMAMRTRHDTILNAQDELLNEYNNLEVLQEGESQDYYNKKKQEIETKVNGLANKLNSTGAGDISIMNDFRTMKRDYNKEVSATGATGRLVNIKKDLDAKKAAYYEWANQQGQPVEAIETNWNNEYKRWLGSNDMKRIDADEFAFKPLDMKLAPKAFDEVVELKKSYDMIGHISSDVLESSYTIDGAGNIVTTSEANKHKENLPQLKSWAEYMNLKLNDPNSEFMQDQRYKNPGVSDDILKQRFLEKIMKVKGMAEISETSQGLNVKIQPQNQDDGSGRGSGDKAKKEPNAKLAYTPTGKEIVEKGKGFASVKAEIDAIEKQEQKGFASEDESKKSAYRKQQLINLQRGITNVEAEKKNELIAEAKKEGFDYFGAKKEVDRLSVLKNEISKLQLTGDKEKDKVILEQKYKSINETFKKSFGKEFGNYDRQKYLQYSGRILNSKSQEEKEDLFNNFLEESGINPVLSSKINEQNSKIDEVFKNVATDESLSFSRRYDLSWGKSSNDVNEEISKTGELTATSILQLAKNTGGSFQTEFAGEFYDTGTNVGEDGKFAELEKIFGTTKDFKIGLQAIIDSGVDGPAQVVFEYQGNKDKEAVKGSIRINYDENNSDKLDKLFGYLQQNLDKEGQEIVKTIMDNKNLNKLAPSRAGDINAKGELLFDKNTGERIKQHNKEILGEQMFNSDLKAISFINPNEDHILLQRQDGLYTMAKTKNKNKKDLEYLSFGNFIDTTMSRESYSNGKVKDQYTGLESDVIPKRVDKATNPLQKNNVVASISNLMLYSGQGLLSVGDMSTEDGKTQIARFKEDREKYLQFINDNENNLDAQYSYTVDFVNKYKNYTFASANKKHLL